MRACEDAADACHDARGLYSDSRIIHQALDCDLAQLEYLPWIKERLRELVSRI